MRSPRGTITSSAAAFQQLSGEAQASLAPPTFNQNQMLGERDRQPPAGSQLCRLPAAAAAGLGAGGPTLCQEREVKAGPFSNAAAPAPDPQSWTGWVQGYGQWNHLSGNGNASTLDSTVGGVLAGADTTANNWTFGFAAGYSWTTRRWPSSVRR